MASEYCWMEPANGCRICMRILSGSGKAPWVWSNGGLARTNLRSPPATPRYPKTGPTERKTHGDHDGIETYPGVSAPHLHIGFRRRRKISSLRPGPNLRKGTSYEGEKCGGLQPVRTARLLRRQIPPGNRPLLVIGRIQTRPLPG